MDNKIYVLLGVVFEVWLTVGIFMNIASTVLIAREKRTHNVSHWFIKNLSWSDIFCYSVFIMWSYMLSPSDGQVIGKYPASKLPIIIKLFIIAYVPCSCCNAIFMVALTVSRFSAIRHRTLEVKTTSARSHCFTVIIWMIGLSSYIILCTLVITMKDRPNVLFLTFRLISFYLAFHFMITFLLELSLNTASIIYLRTVRSQISNLSTVGTRGITSRLEMRFFVQCSVIIFFGSIHCLYWIAFLPLGRLYIAFNIIFDIMNLVCHTINPFVFLVMSQQVRHRLTKLLWCMRVHDPSSTHALYTLKIR